MSYLAPTAFDRVYRRLPFAVVSALAFLVLRQLSLDPGLGTRSRDTLNRLSTIPAATGAVGLAGFVSENGLLGNPFLIPVFAFAWAVPLLEISMRALTGGAGYRRLAGLAATLCVVANLVVTPGLHSALISTLTGLTVTILGYSERTRSVFASGLIAFLAGVAYQCYTAFESFDLTSWSMLAVIGMIAIVSGSILERYGAILKARLSNWRQSFQEWSI